MSDASEKTLDVIKTVLLLNDSNNIHPSFLTKCIHFIRKTVPHGGTFPPLGHVPVTDD